MKKVKFNGDSEMIMPSIGVTINPGDEIDVDDDFENALFTLVEVIKNKKGDNE